MELITCKKLNFTYPGCEEPTLRNIDLTIHRAEFVLLCGKSGCGKSTLLRHLKKNMMPYGKLEGSICYRGQEIEDLPKRLCASEIGFVQQNPDNQIVTDKVWHELAFGLESLGVDNRTIKRRVAEMASFFGIQTWFRKDVSELSGGQKQLLNLASIMVMRPKLLILDEPTSQLDPIAASEFLATLKKINTELGTTILISEHRLEELFPMADRVLVMDKGTLQINDTPRMAVQRLSAGECSEMFHGLPAVVKIACASGEQENCPLTVREGRNWLEARLGEAKTDHEAENRRAGITKRGFGKRKQTEQPAIEMQSVWFRYDPRGADVLRGVDLALQKGELLAVLGGNGVGKSTTLKVLTKTVKADRGTVWVAGKKLNTLSEKELFCNGISLLPQNPQALFTEITVREELLEALCYESFPAQEKEQRVQAVLEEMELQHLTDAHPYDLSGGEQQRLALGKILLLKPKILLLDEPTKGLDPFFKRTLAEIFHRLCEQGVSILMVTHDIEFCASYADRCALFFDGEVVSCGTPKEFFAGNSFYTTSANRLAGAWFPDAVTWEEVVKRCEEATMQVRQQRHTESGRQSLQH